LTPSGRTCSPARSASWTRSLPSVARPLRRAQNAADEPVSARGSTPCGNDGSPPRRSMSDALEQELGVAATQHPEPAAPFEGLEALNLTEPEPLDKARDFIRRGGLVRIAAEPVHDVGPPIHPALLLV